MLSGSAILRVSLLLVVAGCLAALVQYLLPHAVPAPEAPATAALAPATRKIEMLPVPQSAPQPGPVLLRAPAASPAPAPAPSTRKNAEVPAPTPPPQPAPAEFTLPQLSQPMGETAVSEANDNAGPRALALVDLNSASLAQLNGLRGGGGIGRAIVQRRPYTAIDQLLSKRVLSRATYDKIKDQVTVR